MRLWTQMRTMMAPMIPQIIFFIPQMYGLKFIGHCQFLIGRYQTKPHQLLRNDWLHGNWSTLATGDDLMTRVHQLPSLKLT